MKTRDSGARYRAVLTGATGGIGQSIARALSGQCDSLILVGRKRESLQALQCELGESKTFIVEGDLAQQATLDAIETLARRHGGLDLLINNAGVGDFHAFESQRPETIRALLETNLLAPMLLTRQLLPLLKEAGSAQIINVGSLFAYIGFPGFAAYGASKAGLKGFTQALRRELADTAVEARHFVPRATRTAINSDAASGMNRELKTAEDTPEQVAHAFMQFLAGSQWERTIGMKEAFFVLVNQLLPGMPDRTIRAQLPVIRKHLPR